MPRVKKEFQQVVNMPQMALTGLSESWLMKEIGDCHWHMLCEDLELKSNEIFDEFGNRLYATFVRIKFESQSCLRDYAENDLLNISAAIRKFSSSLYYSQIDLACDDRNIKCSLATTFSTRENDADNTKLTKGVPSKAGEEIIVKVSEMPSHILDIVKIKKNTIPELAVSDHHFKITDEVIHETSYRINPYTDINGVGLLYFAAYPLINDICELDYFNNAGLASGNWALSSSTMTRDVFYFGNCNLEDVISYRLNSFELIGDDRIAIQSTLFRECTNSPIAKIFTIKRIN